MQASLDPSRVSIPRESRVSIKTPPAPSRLEKERADKDRAFESLRAERVSLHKFRSCIKFRSCVRIRRIYIYIYHYIIYHILYTYTVSSRASLSIYIYIYIYYRQVLARDHAPHRGPQPLRLRLRRGGGRLPLSESPAQVRNLRLSLLSLSTLSLSLPPLSLSPLILPVPA